ncbi:RteC domain-containing protein [Niastella caeni]|nr:RteC domain-containing protein [Niastella caeni]
MTNQLCFQQQCTRLYRKMLQQLAGFENTATDEKKWIEWGFCVATKTWFRIQAEVDSYQFADQLEEINFYKTLKPKFIGLMDFFSLLYKTVLFQPDDSEGKMEYWKEELAICKNFLLKHSAFCQYYKQGYTGMDHIYFVHENNREPLIFGTNENKGHVVTSYSHLLARVISITKYQRYLQEKIGFLTNVN